MPDPDPFSQDACHRRLVQLSEELTKITNELSKATREEAAAEAAFKGRRAKAKIRYDLAEADAWLTIQGHKGTVPEKQAEILRLCRTEYAESVRAEAGAEFSDWKTKQSVTRTLMESGENIRSSMTAEQSLLKDLRETIYHATGRGG